MQKEKKKDINSCIPFRENKLAAADFLCIRFQHFQAMYCPKEFLPLHFQIRIKNNFNYEKLNETAAKQKLIIKT